MDNKETKEVKKTFKRNTEVKKNLLEEKVISISKEVNLDMATQEDILDLKQMLQ